MSNRRRPLRLVFSLVLSTSLIGAMLASTALAAPANIGIGGGTTVGKGLRAATPQQVSPGKVAGFYLWIRNDDAANLSSFFMKAVAASPVGAYWSRNDEHATHSCGTGAPLVCDFGALNSGDWIRITAAFTVQGGISRDNCKLKSTDPGFEPTATETSWTCVDFQFGANSGFVTGKNKSRGDAYHWYDYAATDTGDDRGATFPFCDLQANPECVGSVLSVSNTAATRNNVQSTKVTAPNVDEVFNSTYTTTGLAVADNFGPEFDCEELGNPSSCTDHETTGSDAFVGQWSQVDVNSSEDTSEDTFGDEFIRVDMSMYGVNPNSIDGVVHFWFDGTNWQEDLIGPIRDECPSVAGPADGEVDPCFWVSSSGKFTTVSVWLHNNGRIRTF